MGSGGGGDAADVAGLTRAAVGAPLAGDHHTAAAPVCMHLQIPSRSLLEMKVTSPRIRLTYGVGLFVWLGRWSVSCAATAAACTSAAC